MPVTTHKRIALTLAVIALLLGGLLVSGGSVVRAGQNDQSTEPVNVAAGALAPGVVLVSWNYLGDVATLDADAPFVVYNDTTGESRGTNATSVTVLGLAPSHGYQFRVCANYPTGQVCAGDVSVTTQPAQTSTASAPTPAPWITGYVPTSTSIYISWGTPGFNFDFDMYTIRLRQKAAPGAPDNAFRDIDISSGGATGSYTVGSLTPSTTYQFEIRGCFKDFFVFNGCPNAPWGPLYEATTLFAGAIPSPAGSASRPTPVIFSNEPDEYSISLSWNVSPRYTYGKYVVQYQPQTGVGAPPAKPMTADAPGGASGNYEVDNLNPGTSYVFTVQGCDSSITYAPNAAPVVGWDCATPSAPYTAATRAPLVTGGGTIIGNVPATISLSPPTITSGNSVTITGSSFPLNDGPVSVGYGWSATNPTGGGSSSGSGGGSPVTTVSAQGTFSATLTIPSDVPPTSVTISAQSKSAQATATLQVVAPSSKGTLTLTYTPLVGSGGVVTDFAPDTSGYALSGTNFAPGQVTIFFDSPQGTQLLTATVGAGGTFTQAFDPTSTQLGGKTGQHTLVAVQNGAVAGQLSVTVDQPVHVG